MKINAGVLLVMVVLCAGCAPKPPPAETSENSKPEKALDAVAAKDAAAVAPDPLTVAAGTLSIAASLKSLFGGDDRDTRSLKRKLDAVRAQNQVTHEMLGQVLDILKNLGVTVREAVKHETIVLMQAQLRSEIDQFYETYDAELSDRRARPDARRRYETEIIGDVQNISSTLMQEPYGFAAANTVGHGMILDLWMARRIGWQSRLIGNRAKTYREYFQRALDEKAPDSPAARLAEARARSARLQAVLVEADRTIGTAGWSMVVRRFTDNRTRGRCWETFRVTVTDKATGNQLTGYSVERSRVESGLTRECDRHEPRCPVCDRLKSLSLDDSKSSADPSRPASETPAAMVPYWNAVLASRKEADSEVEVLAKVNDALKEYLAFAQLVERRP